MEKVNEFLSKVGAEEQQRKAAIQQTIKEWQDERAECLRRADELRDGIKKLGGQVGRGRRRKKEEATDSVKKQPKPKSAA